MCSHRDANGIIITRMYRGLQHAKSDDESQSQTWFPESERCTNGSSNYYVKKFSFPLFSFAKTKKLRQQCVVSNKKQAKGARDSYY